MMPGATGSNRMPVRTTETTVTFARPFALGSFDAPQPAGTYRVVTEEEEIEGLSFPAYRLLSTILYTPAVSVIASLHEAFPVNAAELAAALETDRLGSAPLKVGTGLPEK
jgi:hypothetical protein